MSDKMAAGLTVLPSTAVSSMIDMPICELEEIKRMKILQKKGERALARQRFEEALGYLTEAREMDDKNSDVLATQAAAFISLGQFHKANSNAMLLIQLNERNAQGHYINGVAQRNLGNLDEALKSFLVALQLDQDQSIELTDQIAMVCAMICGVEDPAIMQLTGMDCYRKLNEIGQMLYNAKEYQRCIAVLETTLKFRTNQKGITVRIQLTLATAYAAVKQTDQSIALYLECYGTAVSIHDYLYQTKSLVNVASLYLESRNTHQAIVHYEKLLALQDAMLLEFGTIQNLPDFWTVRLRCGLHLNLSIAYKAIGHVDSALCHAQKYVSLLEENEMTGRERAESYHNVGVIHELLGHYKTAIEYYQKYYKDSRGLGMRKSVGQAYGCLGSVYAQLHNWPTSLLYHKQYVNIAKKSGDQTLIVTANEMLGDSLMLKGDYEEAERAYRVMLEEAGRTDYRNQAMAKCRIGDAYVGQGKSEHALHYYEKCLDLCVEMDYEDIETLCEYNMAMLYKKSTQYRELEKSVALFEKLISQFEWKLQQYREERSFCSPEYMEKLEQCYNGVLSVFSLIGTKDSLSYVEAYYRHSPGNIIKSSITRRAPLLHLDGAHSALTGCSIDELTRIVSEQNAFILYYKTLPESFLLWLIEPAKGITNFYVGKSTSNGIQLMDEIKHLIDEVKKANDEKKMSRDVESRLIPVFDQKLQYVRQSNRNLSKPNSKVTKDGHIQMENVSEEPKSSQKYSLFQRLYLLLLGPLDDAISAFDDGSPVVVIADGVIADCPFNQLENWRGVPLHSRCRITYSSNLTLLRKTTSNELDRLADIQEIDNQRRKMLNGGFGMLPSNPPAQSFLQMNGVKSQYVSNPRLLQTIQRTDSVSDVKFDVETNESFVKYGHRYLPLEEVNRNDRQLLEQKMKSGPDKHLLHLAKTPVIVKHAVESINTLTNVTATKTDITSSNFMVPKFQQIAYFDRCVVIGNPTLPKTLRLPEKTWSPVEPLMKADSELDAVGRYVDAKPVTGAKATKATFLTQAASATVLHIVTYACLQSGYLVFTPDFSRQDNAPPDMRSYLVTPQDIVENKLHAQLIVLSCGWGVTHTQVSGDPSFLANLFIAAGAQCVLMMRWPTPTHARDIFFYHFYTALQSGNYTSTALQTAITALRNDNRYSDSYYWSGYRLIGKDVWVDIKSIRHAQLDQDLNQHEASVQEQCTHDLLNPRAPHAHIQSKKEHLNKLQTYMGELLAFHKDTPNVLSHLIDLIDEALKRLHTRDNRPSTHLPHIVFQHPTAMRILRLLWFDFQADTRTGENLPHVIYPHWNVNDLLVPVYDALRAVTELSENEELARLLYTILPLPQNVISHLVDVLCITKHAPEIQLRITDLSVRSIWTDSKMHSLMSSIGFQQIGPLINFSASPYNRVMLLNTLQLLLALSCYKSPVLLHKLDVNYLGKPPTKQDFGQTDLHEIPSLSPLLLHRNQLTMATPWMSRVEQQGEMLEKISLAKSKSSLDKDYEEYRFRAKNWLRAGLVSQANETLAEYGKQETPPTRVNKSRDVTSNNNSAASVLGVAKQRNHAHYVFDTQIGGLKGKHNEAVKNLYLPYIVSN